MAWNSARKLLDVKDTSTPISNFKDKLKIYLLEKQLLGDFEDPYIYTKKWTEIKIYWKLNKFVISKFPYAAICDLIKILTNQPKYSACVKGIILNISTDLRGGMLFKTAIYFKTIFLAFSGSIVAISLLAPSFHS